MQVYSVSVQLCSFRVLGLGTDFVEAFLYVLYDVRYFILFIVTCVLGTALCFATLYRADKVNIISCLGASCY